MGIKFIMGRNFVVLLRNDYEAFEMIGFFSIWTQADSRKAIGNTSAPTLRLGAVKLCLIERNCYKKLNTANITQANLQFSNILLPPPVTTYVTKSYIQKTPDYVLTVCRYNMYPVAARTFLYNHLTLNNKRKISS